MVCPFCLHKKTIVYNSRPTKRLNAIWRRRQCLACEREFTTREQVATEGVLKVKTGNKKVKAFLKSKLLLSIIKVCDHRSEEDDAAYWLCDTIEQRLLKQAATHEGYITTQDITEACLATLKVFDTPAFVKYLSYHGPTLDSRALKQHLKQ